MRPFHTSSPNIRTLAMASASPANLRGVPLGSRWQPTLAPFTPLNPAAQRFLQVRELTHATRCDAAPAIRQMRAS